MPELARSFTTAFPSAQLHQVEHDQQGLIDALRHAGIDVAVAYDMQLADDIEFLSLASLSPHVWVAESDPLAREAPVGLRNLATAPLVLLDLPMSREYFLALFMKEGLEPRIAVRSMHFEVVRTMVANGYGYTLANVRPRPDVALDGRRIARLRLAGDPPRCASASRPSLGCGRRVSSRGSRSAAGPSSRTPASPPWPRRPWKGGPGNEVPAGA